MARMHEGILAPHPAPGFIPRFLAATLCLLNIKFPNFCSTKTRCLTVLFGALPFAVACIINGLLRSEGALFALFLGLLLVAVLSGLFFLSLVLKVARGWAENRLNANDSAKAVVLDGIDQCKVVVGESYDLFFPSKDRHAPAGLFLFPGALVDRLAYAGVARRLSERGILVAIANSEPQRITSPIFGYHAAFVESCIANIKEEHDAQATVWGIGGHSYGAVAAQVVVNENLSYIRKVILWGSYSPLILRGGAPVDVLLITASNDGLKPQNWTAFSNSQARGKTTHYEIDGGNHSGFGDYPKQTYPKVDGERTISLEEQHKQVVQQTANFLLEK